MKLNVVLVDGTTREIEIESAEENVSTFRENVGILFSINRARIQLAFRGKFLRDEETLSMHGINEGHYINCVVLPESYISTSVSTPSSASENESNNTAVSSINNTTSTQQVTESANNNTVVVKIKLLNGNDREMEVNRFESVDNFRIQLARLINVIDSSRLRLIHMGRVLENGDSLALYNVNSGSWIHCTVRPEGAPPSQTVSRRPSNTSQIFQTSPPENASNNLGIASQLNVQSLGNGVMMGSISIETSDLELLSASGMNIETIVNQMLISQGMRPTATTISAISTTPAVTNLDTQSSVGSGSGSGPVPQRRPSLIAATSVNEPTGVQTSFQRFRDYPLQSEPSTDMRNSSATQQAESMQERLRLQTRGARTSLPRLDNPTQSDATATSQPYAPIPSLLQGPMLRQDSNFSALESTAGSRPQSYNFNHMTPQQAQMLLAQQGTQGTTNLPTYQGAIQESYRRRHQVEAIEAARRASVGSVASRTSTRMSHDSRAPMYRLSAVDRRFQGTVESGLGSARQLATSLQQLTGARATMSNVGDAQAPSQAMGSMLWDLSVCLNGLQVPLATMSNRMTGDAFFADTQTMDGRVEQLSELSRMRAILSNLAETANKASEALGLLGMEVQATVSLGTGTAQAPVSSINGPIPTTAVYSNPSSVAGTPPMAPATRTMIVQNNSIGSGESNSNSSAQSSQLELPAQHQSDSTSASAVNSTELRAGASTPVAQEVLSWRRALSQSTRSEAEESEVFEESAVPADENLDDDMDSPREHIPEETTTSPTESASWETSVQNPIASSTSTAIPPSRIGNVMFLVPMTTTPSTANTIASNVSNPSPLLQNQPISSTPVTLPLPAQVQPTQFDFSAEPTQRVSSRDTAESNRNPWRLFRSAGR